MYTKDLIKMYTQDLKGRIRLENVHKYPSKINYRPNVHKEDLDNLDLT